MNITLLEALSSNAPPWLMSQSERMALLAVLLLTKPAQVLEIGTNEGGCTKWLSSLCGHVTTVDIVKRIPGSIETLHNVSFLTMTSKDAFGEFKKTNTTFDLAIVDGDHSYEGSRSDLIDALGCASIIICHDSYNPPCRQGYTDAINTSKKDQLYYNPDFVQGTVSNNELWGGLALIIRCVKNTPLIPSDDNYTPLHAYLEQQSNRERGILQTIMHRLARTFQRPRQDTQMTRNYQ